jgi:hypothetical protein
MAAIIKGITVELLVRTESGVDDFNAAIYTETAEEVENVLVAPLTDEERASETNLTGRRAVYQLGIPKGDRHEWTAGTKVRFFGQTWRIIGEPVMGIEAMIPLDWNMKVKVECCV